MSFIARTTWVAIHEKLYLNYKNASSIVLITLISAFLLTLILKAYPAMMVFGRGFLFSNEWNPVLQQFGGAAFLAGTIISSLLALCLALPLSLAIAVYSGLLLKNKLLKTIIRTSVDILSGIPSVVYGFWALQYLVPLVRSAQTSVGEIPYGVSLLTATIVLTIMIVPFASMIIREVLGTLDEEVLDSARALGATSIELTRYIIIPYTRSGIFAGTLLSLGRALGETMAVTMVIGNANVIPHSIWEPANTVASLLANEFPEAVSGLYQSSLMYLALILFLITAGTSILGRGMIRWFQEK